MKTPFLRITDTFPTGYRLHRVNPSCCEEGWAPLRMKPAPGKEKGEIDDDSSLHSGHIQFWTKPSLRKAQGLLIVPASLDWSPSPWFSHVSMRLMTWCWFYRESNRIRGAKWLTTQITQTSPEFLTPHLKFLSMETIVMTFFSKIFSDSIWTTNDGKFLEGGGQPGFLQSSHKLASACFQPLPKLCTPLLRSPTSSSHSHPSPHRSLSPFTTFIQPLLSPPIGRCHGEIVSLVWRGIFPSRNRKEWWLQVRALELSLPRGQVQASLVITWENGKVFVKWFHVLQGGILQGT